MEALSFTTDDAGDLSGKWQQYYSAGTLYGTYTLTPSASQPPSTTSFSSQSYTGTVIVKNGSGVNAKVTGKGTVPARPPTACTTRAPRP